MKEDVVLQASGLYKSFGHVAAVTDASVAVRHGEIVGLVGDNGAGKSTLVSLLCGVHVPDAGRMWLNGSPVSLDSVSTARRHGIETMFQDLGLCEQLAIYENIFLGRELTMWRLALRRGAMKRRADALLREFGLDIGHVDGPTSELSGGQRQLVALARLALKQVTVAILDEPTAALSVRASEQVYDMVKRLAARGVGVLIVSHNLADVLRICDAVVVMRHGRTVARVATSDVKGDDLVGLITGTSIESSPSSTSSAVAR